MRDKFSSEKTLQLRPPRIDARDRDANHLEAEIKKLLREAAWWVVILWDTEGTQHNSMPALRRAIGLPGERPTRDEAEARLTAYLCAPEVWCGAAPLPGSIAGGGEGR